MGVWWKWGYGFRVREKAWLECKERGLMIMVGEGIVNDGWA